MYPPYALYHRNKEEAMILDSMSFSALIQIDIFYHPISHNPFVFSSMIFREPFTEELRDSLFAMAFANYDAIPADEKNAEDKLMLAIAETKMAEVPWQEPPHIALTCAHRPMDIVMERGDIQEIERDIAKKYQRHHSILGVPRILFQVIELLPCVRIISLPPLHSLSAFPN